MLSGVISLKTAIVNLLILLENYLFAGHTFILAASQGGSRNAIAFFRSLNADFLRSFDGWNGITLCCLLKKSTLGKLDKIKYWMSKNKLNDFDVFALQALRKNIERLMARITRKHACLSEYGLLLDIAPLNHEGARSFFLNYWRFTEHGLRGLLRSARRGEPFPRAGAIQTRSQEAHAGD